MLSDSLSHTQECKEAGGQETTRLWKHNTWNLEWEWGPESVFTAVLPEYQTSYRDLSSLFLSVSGPDSVCVCVCVCVYMCACAREWLIPQEIVWHLIWQGVAGGALTQHQRKSTSLMECVCVCGGVMKYIASSDEMKAETLNTQMQIMLLPLFRKSHHKTGLYWPEGNTT